VRPISRVAEVEEDDVALAGGAEQRAGSARLDIPPNRAELDRRLTLAHLVTAWAKGSDVAPLVVGAPASTLALASDLARLMDDMATRGVEWDRLDGLLPDQLDHYWPYSADFLRIARQPLPDDLQEI